jgi:hypothetical protein
VVAYEYLTARGVSFRSKALNCCDDTRGSSLESEEEAASVYESSIDRLRRVAGSVATLSWI